MKLLKFSPKQEQIFNFIADDNRYLICDGAVRSGKTVPMALAFILFGLLKFNNAKLGICSKTTRTAERNILDPLFAIDGLPFAMKYNRGTMVLTANWGNTTNEYHIFGANDEKAAAKVQGITLASVFFDEVVLMPESFVSQAIARLLTDPKAKAWFSCNPESPQHWFFKSYIEKRKPLTKYLHFDMSDNPLMTPEAIERAKSSFSGVFLQRYIYGFWSVAEGAIYPVFSENKAKYICNSVPELPRLNVYAGLDFGGNKSHHAVTVTAIDTLKREIWVLHSESFKAENITPDELYSRVNAILQRVEKDFQIKVQAIYADSAEQTLINGLRVRIPVPVRNSIKEPINDRIRVTTSLMASGRFHLIRNRCWALETAFEAAVWDEKKLDDTRLDNGTYNVDILDSFEYSFERYLRALAGLPAENPEEKRREADYVDVSKRHNERVWH